MIVKGKENKPSPAWQRLMHTCVDLLVMRTASPQLSWLSAYPEATSLGPFQRELWPLGKMGLCSFSLGMWTTETQMNNPSSS